MRFPGASVLLAQHSSGFPQGYLWLAAVVTLAATVLGVRKDSGGPALGITAGMGGGYSYFHPVVPGLGMYGVSVF